MFDIDLLGYAGNVALSDTGDATQAHRMVYREALTPHLRGLDTDERQGRVMRRRASDSDYSALYLPYFSIKPLYVLTMEAVHKFGVSVVDSSRLVSALSYFAVAVVVWLYTRSWLGLLILVIPETLVLGQANEPDGMSASLLLLGLWMLFLKRRDLGLLPLFLALWVRPDNFILCLLALGVLVFQQRLEIGKAAVLFLLCVGSQVLISHYAYGWRELYAHTFLGAEPGTAAVFGLRDYLHAFTKGVIDLLHSTVPVFALLGLVCFPRVEPGLRQVLAIVVVFSGVRFVMFPSYEVRYYAPFFIVTSTAAVILATLCRPRAKADAGAERFPAAA